MLFGLFDNMRFKRLHELSKIFEKLLGHALGVLQMNVKVTIKCFRVWCRHGDGEVPRIEGIWKY